MAKIRGPSCRKEGGVLGWEMTALVGSASGDRFKSFASLSVLSSHSIHVAWLSGVENGIGHQRGEVWIWTSCQLRRQPT